MIITNKINVHIHQNGEYHLDAVQGDTGRVLELSFYAGGESWPVPRGAALQVRFRKPDGTGGYYDTLPNGTKAYIIRDNVAVCALAPQVLTVAGEVEAQVLVIWEKKELATFTIRIQVQEDPSLGVLESEDYVNLTQWVENRVGEYLSANPLTINEVSYNGSEAVTVNVPAYRKTPDPEVCDGQTAKLVEDGFYLIRPENWSDFPVEMGSCALLVFRYCADRVVQMAIGLDNGKIYDRIVNRETIAVYRDWCSPGGVPVARILCAGDSIAQGQRNDYKGFVGDLGMPYRNVAVDGATLSNAVTACANIPDQLAAVTDYDPDIVIANGGINDYTGNVPLGTVPQAMAVDVQTLDRSTVLGGLEYLFCVMKSRFPDAKHYFLLTHKTLDWPTKINSAGYTQADMFDAFKLVCSIYGVGVVDVYGLSGIDTACSVFIAPQAYSDDPSLGDLHWVDRDGVHPLSFGYLQGYLPVVRQVMGLAGKEQRDARSVTDLAEANARKGKYRLVQRKEVTDSTTTGISFDDLRLLKLRAYLTVPQASKNVSVGAEAYIGTELVGYAWLASVINTSASRSAMIEAANDSGLVSFENTSPATPSSNTQIFMKSPNRKVAYGPFTKLAFNASGVECFPAGTTVELWGIEY